MVQTAAQHSFYIFNKFSSRFEFILLLAMQCSIINCKRMNKTLQVNTTKPVRNMGEFFYLKKKKKKEISDPESGQHVIKNSTMNFKLLKENVKTSFKKLKLNFVINNNKQMNQRN